MNHSGSLKEIAVALIKVQSELRPAKKDANNPYFDSKYADLNSIWDSCRAILSQNGLSVTQLNEPNESGITIETVLLHESGEWISGTMSLPVKKQDAQAYGSAMTYGRRYGLAAILGIVADEDDDGNSASEEPKNQPKLMTGNQQEQIANIVKGLDLTKEETGQILQDVAGHSDRTKLTEIDGDNILKVLRQKESK